MPRKLSILLLVIVAISVLCLRLVRTATPPNPERSTPAQSDDAATHARRYSGERLQPPTAGSRSLVPSPADLASSQAPFASFVYSNGAPAAGLGVSGASEAGVYEIEVSRKPPDWTERLDEQGRMAADMATRLGALISVRLSSCSLQLMRLEPSEGQRYVLPDIVSQTFRLPLAAPGVTVVFRIENSFLGIGSSIEFESELTGAEFADRFRVTAAGSLREARVIACARGELSSDQPTIRLLLPAGPYSISPLTCSFGWWFDDFDANVGGGSIDIAVHQVPVTTVLLPAIHDGNVRKPTAARVLVADRTPDESGGSGEVEVPWKVEGDRLLVAQVYRDPGDESQYTYALKIYWSDGTDSTTRPGNWQSLLGTVTFDT